MFDFGISSYKELRLLQGMAQSGIREEDIQEKFIRSQGPGGQNVNKTSTCVYLRHLPTGIEVKCQRERSQAQNRYIARKILLEKIQRKKQESALSEKARLEKIRRQKRTRSKKSKLRMLESKRHNARKKRLRTKVKDLE